MRTRAFRSSLGSRALAVALVTGACTYNFDRFLPAESSSSGGNSGTETGGFDGLGGVSVGGGMADGGLAGRGGAPGGQAGRGGAGGAVGGSGPADAGNDAPVGGSPGVCQLVGGTVYNGHCYYLNTTSSTFDVAATACPSLPGFHLVSLTSAEEQAAVTPLVSGTGKDSWIGLQEPRSTYTQKKETNFFWVNNEPYNPQTSYRNWDSTDASTEPSFVGDCVSMHPSGKWASAKCDASLSFICEHD